MTCFYIFSVLFDFLHLRLCHSGRFCLVGTNSPRRFPLERKENVSLVLLGRCGSMWIWSFRCCWRHHDFVVFGLITAVPVDTKNTWQALNHAVTTQDVERVDLSVVHKELQDKQWFDSEGHVIRRSCDQKVVWSDGHVIRRSGDQILISDWPFRLGGRCRFGRRIRAVSLCILQAEGRSLADALMTPHGNELYSHPVCSWK